MNLKPINRQIVKARKEAESTIKKVIKRHSIELRKIIASQLPKGHTLHSGNGLVWIKDKNGKMLKEGKAWGLPKDTQLDQIAELQYAIEFKVHFNIPDKIKSSR
jgi:hypothetical protein